MGSETAAIGQICLSQRQAAVQKRARYERRQQRQMECR
jgi:hypothetical protein